MVEVEVPRVGPHARNEDLRVLLLVVLAVHVHPRHEDLLPEDAATVRARRDRLVVAGDQPAAHGLDAETREDEHDDDHEDRDEDDLLEAAEQLQHDAANVRHERVDAKWTHRSTDHEHLRERVDLHVLRHRHQEDQTGLKHTIPLIWTQIFVIIYHIL